MVAKSLAEMKDVPDSQKKRPEEDFENKKLVPVLREAFDLLELMEMNKREAQKQISKIKRSQKTLRGDKRNFNEFKKAQTKVDVSIGSKEKIVFRTIMCPMRDQCPRDKSKRWPTSNISSHTKFGQDCPFAHHPSELMFPESILTKVSSSKQTIKKLEEKILFEKPRAIFKPASVLKDCAGCSDHTTSCNFCKYKAMAGKTAAAFNDDKKKTKLMQSMSRREDKAIKEERDKLHEIARLLDLDNNFAIKFGMLKKACVLKFYGRFNDSFDVIANAAKIV